MTFSEGINDASLSFHDYQREDSSLALDKSTLSVITGSCYHVWSDIYVTAVPDPLKAWHATPPM
jgi:hypothetical protein